MHLRPLGIGGNFRRIAARCVALRTKGNNAASVGIFQEPQFGVGIKRALGALVKAKILSAMLLTDTGNGYCSIIQDGAIGGGP